ncbi:hypothetical protein C8R45DRAFT_1193664 [Mycena sanguinolenta]|nr:hypothetical protein C8R45DRAFT_1193664 [Mycena sanguinolenta]
MCHSYFVCVRFPLPSRSCAGVVTIPTATLTRTFPSFLLSLKSFGNFVTSVRLGPHWEVLAIEEWLVANGRVGKISFILDLEPQFFGSAPVVSIQYWRNASLVECPENEALREYNAVDGLRGLTIRLIDRILARAQPKRGMRTHMDFRTLTADSFDVQILAEKPLCPLSLPSAPTFPSTELDEAARVMKLCSVEVVEFILQLLNVDFLVKPTRTVLDDTAGFYGLLMDHHPPRT